MDLTPAHQLAHSRLFLTQEDVDDIMSLVYFAEKINSSLREINVWDIGAGSGTTAIAVLQCEVPVNVLTVDISQANLDWASLNIEANEVAKDNWQMFQGDLESAFLKNKSEKIQLLLHDADHSEEAVRNDLYIALENLEKNSLIWVHDYLPMPGAQETYPGVKIVCDELVENKLVRKLKTTGIGFAARVL